MSVIDDWIATAVGRAMNPDGAYGNQCKDVIDDYCLKLFGDWVNTIRPGDAKDCFDNANPDFFTKVKNDPADPNQIPPRGAIVVLNGVFNNGPGHIFVVENSDTNGIDAIEQNGFTVKYDAQNRVIDPGLSAYRKRYANSIYEHMEGWLIPKLQGEQNMSNADINILRIVHSELEGWPLEATHRGDYDQQFLAAYGTETETNSLILEKWKSGGAFRAKREENARIASTAPSQISGLTDKLADLTTQYQALVKSTTPLPPTGPVNPPATTTQANPANPGLASVLGSDWGKAVLQVAGAVGLYLVDNATQIGVPPALAAVIGLAIGHTASNLAATKAKQ